MRHSIDRAAVLGAGVMGATLAAHLANAGIPTLLLDIVPPEGSGVEGEPASREYRDAFARGGLQRAQKARPAAFYTPARARLVTTGNTEDDLDKLRDVDLVLEAVTEKIDIKRSLYEAIQPFLKDTAILASNTSGLSVNAMAEVIDEPLRTRFLVMHFFNPPRYMHLLEIVPHKGTAPEVVDAMAHFGEVVLGKGVVHAKDTPNFIANRIGVYSMASTLHAMVESGFTPETVDALTGPLIGRPKSASLRTADLVGLDTFVHVSDTVYDNAPDDEGREQFKLPDVVQRMVKEGRIGDKSGQGFYKKTKKDGKTEILSLDMETFEYTPREREKFASLEMAKALEDLGPRIKALLAGKDRAAQFLWKTLSDTMLYAANRLGEIAADVQSIDDAMRWGFNWDMGPFELWDALGVKETAERMRADGRDIPAVVEEVIASDGGRFYADDDNFTRHVFTPGKGLVAHEQPATKIDLARLKEQGKTVKSNAGASLVDIGDGVLCLEFHSKMNAIGGDIIQMVHAGIKETEENYDALVIGNQGTNFSVGANLMLLLFEAQEENWEDIDLMVRTFQRATSALKYSKKPVVAAPFAMALGGGAEMVLGAGHAVAAAETYMGLVELGVGLIPAGGGSAEMVFRSYEKVPNVEGVDLFQFVRAAFETIGMAKVSMSGEEARALGFLRHGDGVEMNRDRLLHSAKWMAKGLAMQGYRRPDPTRQVPVVGESGIGSIETHLWILKEGKHISEYDAQLGARLAHVLCGGRVAKGTLVDEQYLLDLEREVFLRLCGERKTLERIQHMLKKGKPLRN